MGKVISEAKNSSAQSNKITMGDNYAEKIKLSENNSAGIGLQQDGVYIRTTNYLNVYCGGEFNQTGPGPTGNTLLTITSTGDANFMGDVTTYYSSDFRLKKNINNLEHVLDKFENINPVYYEFKKPKEFDKTNKHIGLLAQEILPLFPEVVKKRDNGYYAIAYDKLVPVLIQAIKELKSEITKLKKDN